MNMVDHQELRGVYAAALTPIHENGELALEDVPPFLAFLAQRGCHGVLLFGTTGEGPSFAPKKRLELLHVALAEQAAYPQLRFMLGTGTPSLDVTIELTRAAFDAGVDGVMVLPPYYYRKVKDDGLYAWFSQVIRQAVPTGGALFGYHIPPITGVPLSIELVARLKDTFPDRFAGIKDSSVDPDHAHRLGERFGRDLLVLSGSDSLFSLALEYSASGCITALANLRSPDLRLVWDAHAKGGTDPAAQARLDAARAVMDRFPPNPPLYKALLARLHSFPRWAVLPPLMPLSAEWEARALREALAEVEGFAL
jgi:4-hydroxy-tetrahydrodipicolinate synthase